MKSSLRIFWSKLAIVSAALVVAVGLVAQKLMALAADPTGPKDCPPLFPSPDVPQEPSVDLKDPYGQLNWEQKGGTMNDASCLDQTNVYGVVKIHSEKDIQDALAFARDRGLKVSIAGVKHSMGGHAFMRNAVVLDMTDFNEFSLDEEKKILTVQSGATWHDIQSAIHPKFSVKAMQSTDIFTVGGSISVNAHGMDHQAGSVANTVRSMRIMLADGTIKTASRSENPDLYRAVLGGYGLFGIVLDAELDVTDNVMYASKRSVMDYTEFPNAFENLIQQDKDIGLFYGHLSTSPESLVKEMILYTYTKTDADVTTAPPLGEVSSIKLRRLVINLSKQGPLMRRLKWLSEKYIEPKLESCEVSRTEAMGQGEACLVSRNEPMHDSVKYLKNSLPNETDILHEYFIPRSEFVSYIDGMRTILADQDANILNASVRVVHKEDTLLNYAPEDAYSVVLYINQETDDAGNAKMQKLTQSLIDLTIAHHGRFFLPYQLHYTPQQLLESYPELPAFAAAKKTFDPNLRFTNTWYDTYVKNL